MGPIHVSVPGPRGQPPVEFTHPDDEMFDFVRYLYDEIGVSPDTISNYVSQVVTRYELMNERLVVSPICAQWIRRAKQLPRTSHFKEPITREVIWSLATDDSVDLAIRLAAVLAWFLCLRLGQLVGDTVVAYDDTFDLLRKDCVVVSPQQLVQLRLRKGKSDTYNLGTVRHLVAASPSEPFCPVRLVERYLKETSRFAADEPLLRRSSDGRIVTREPVVQMLKRHAQQAGIPAEFVSGHSLRIGSATAMKAGGLAEEEILYWGQWSAPTSMHRYVRGTVGRAADITDALAVGPGPVVGALAGEIPIPVRQRFPDSGLQPSAVLSSRPRL